MVDMGYYREVSDIFHRWRFKCNNYKINNSGILTNLVNGGYLYTQLTSIEGIFSVIIRKIFGVNFALFLGDDCLFLAKTYPK